MTAALDAIEWPTQSRKIIKGRGTCLGATYDPDGPRLGAYTRRCAEAIKTINSCISEVLGNRNFEWGSLQINKDSVSKPHKDKNNRGPSMVILLGSFTGGAFRMSDNSCSADKSGTAVVIDGTKEHFSEPFRGSRYSIVAFLHTSTAELSDRDTRKLLELGFALPIPQTQSWTAVPRHAVRAGKDGLKSEPLEAEAVTSVGRESSEPVTRCLIEYCCGERSILGESGPYREGL